MKGVQFPAFVKRIHQTKPECPSVIQDLTVSQRLKTPLFIHALGTSPAPARAYVGQEVTSATPERDGLDSFNTLSLSHGPSTEYPSRSQKSCFCPVFPRNISLHSRTLRLPRGVGPALGHPPRLQSLSGALRWEGPKFTHASCDGRRGFGSYRWSSRWEVKAYLSCPG